MTTASPKRSTFAFRVLKVLLDLLDIPVIYGALCLAFWIRFVSGWFAAPLGRPPFAAYQRTFVLVSLLWFAIFALAGLYRERIRFAVEQVAVIVRTVFLGTAALLVGVFFYRDFSYSRLTVLIAVALATALVSLFHLLKLRFQLYLRSRGYGVRRVLIVGGGPLGVDCFTRLQGSLMLAYEPVGFCSTETPEDPPGPHLGSLEACADIVGEHDIDEVFIALSPEQSKRSLEVLRSIEPLGVRIKIVPNIYSLITSSIEVTEMAGMPVLNLGPLPIHGWGGFVKGAVDRAGAFLGMLALSPFFAYVAWKIKHDSPGPVIYEQERVGLDGNPFTIFKFRSMRCDAEESTGPVWATKDDPRRTPFGEFIRKYSIDELPQLYNVFRGDMSLVGPRPERPFFVEQFRKDVPDYMARHICKTGITGWAQVNGLRGQCPIEERTRYDIWYIENWSLFLDLSIILRTVYVCIFKPTGF